VNDEMKIIKMWNSCFPQLVYLVIF